MELIEISQFIIDRKLSELPLLESSKHVLSLIENEDGYRVGPIMNPFYIAASLRL